MKHQIERDVEFIILCVIVFIMSASYDVILISAAVGSLISLRIYGIWKLTVDSK